MSEYEKKLLEERALGEGPALLEEVYLEIEKSIFHAKSSSKKRKNLRRQERGMRKRKNYLK
ncbi:hypothetical protein COU57_03530 [Candidatus Pacearchaeota archaeon CG10_big_fil_rev_8_21_14_0_10_32_14]|nr:MAG: hypothetical protein COU57_03530 [Candidatus Pacearchaeota archaeon CG10_big_fil_rev_8_21_14_0_10_32_14]